MKPKLLHFLIAGCFLLLGAKVADIVSREESLIDALTVSQTKAASTEEEGGDEESEENSEEEGDDEDSTDEESDSEDSEEGTEDEEEVVDVVNELAFSETEVEILKRLKQRREKLQQWEENLQVKDNVLRVTQTKIDQKLQQLRDLKTEVEKLLEQYNEKEDAKIRSLVKIYENMKPKDAAKIFEDLDMDVLLEVVDKMKEAKSALILAKMTPERAKKLTILYAEQRKLSTPE